MDYLSRDLEELRRRMIGERADLYSVTAHAVEQELLQRVAINVLGRLEQSRAQVNSSMARLLPAPQQPVRHLNPRPTYDDDLTEAIYGLREREAAE